MVHFSEHFLDFKPPLIHIFDDQKQQIITCNKKEVACSDKLTENREHISAALQPPLAALSLLFLFHTS